MPTFRAISRAVNLASPSMISFILETISICYADFGLADFGAYLMDFTPDSNFFFSSAELCQKTHKKVHEQQKFQSSAALKNNQALSEFGFKPVFHLSCRHFYMYQPFLL